MSGKRLPWLQIINSVLLLGLGAVLFYKIRADSQTMIEETDIEVRDIT